MQSVLDIARIEHVSKDNLLVNFDNFLKTETFAVIIVIITRWFEHFMARIFM